jgi:hypothetical protein
MKEFIAWARKRSSPRDLVPFAVGGWLLKEGIESGNEMFVFISLYLFGLVPAWWADGKDPTSSPATVTETPSIDPPGGG